MKEKNISQSVICSDECLDACRNNIIFVRLDGTLSQQQRETVINDFKSDPNIMVYMISLV